MTEKRDVVVIGSGISGASLAHHAARAGRDVLVLERAERAGGCLHSVRERDDFWFELGAHTLYNSYGATLELLDHAGALGELIPRSKPVLRFLGGDRLLPGKNLGLMLRQLNKLELLMRMPRWRSTPKEGRTTRAYYSDLVGESNYERVVGPLLSAVPSQCADEIPADLLFKKRERREDVLRSFTFDGGTSRLIELALDSERIETRTSTEVERVEHSADGFTLQLPGGESLQAKTLALAVPPGAAARLTEGVDDRLAEVVREFEEVEIESLALTLPRDGCTLPDATFFIPRNDLFHSIVTRDVVPHASLRAFTFHFKPDTSRETRIARIGSALGLASNSLPELHETRKRLPSPRIGQAERVQQLDARLAGSPLLLTGNWFGGLSIEDCVLRSRSEWRRH